jgi:CBS domain containing-hemolysin-like protein
MTSLFWSLFFLLGGVKLYRLFVCMGLAVSSESEERGATTARLVWHRAEEMNKPWHLLDAALIGMHLAFAIGAVAITFFMMTYVPWGGAGWAVLTSGVIIVFLGDWLPRVHASSSHGAGIKVSVSPLWMAATLFRPLLWLGDQVRRGLNRGEGEQRPLFFSWPQKQEYQLAPRMPEETLDMEERRLIDKISTLDEITIYEAMVPLVQIVAVEERATVNEVSRKIQEYGYSRIPIYRERIYNIIGVVNAFDLLLLSPEVEEIGAIIRPAYYVPHTKRVDSLLQEMQRKGIQMAVVVDEYGGSIGIITIEDLLEEIVGEIEDEYDVGESLYEALPDGGYLFDARMEIDTINEKLGLDLPKGDYETLGGFVMMLLERIPQTGEEFTYEHWEFCIENATERAIHKIKVQPRAVINNG